MKKNNMLRLASVLLVAVLLSTCAIAGAFANYMTELNPSDTARVAKWGVYIEDNAPDMFGDAYGHDGDNKNVIVAYVDEDTDDTLTVRADTKDVKVVAPGTEGALGALTITGKPEVDVNVTYDAELTLTGWTVSGAYYCPIVITVKGDGNATNEQVFNGLDYTSTGDFEKAVEEAIEAKKAYYQTNTDLSCVANDVVVSWVWAYSGNVGANDVAQTVEKDTALGNAAASGSASNIALSIKTTITQAD